LLLFVANFLQSLFAMVLRFAFSAFLLTSVLRVDAMRTRQVAVTQPTCLMKAPEFDFFYSYQSQTGCLGCNVHLGWNEQLLTKVFQGKECSGDPDCRACKPYSDESANGLPVCSCVTSTGRSLFGFRMSDMIATDSECTATTCFKKFAWLHERSMKFKTKLDQNAFENPVALCRACALADASQQEVLGCAKTSFGMDHLQDETADDEQSNDDFFINTEEDVEEAAEIEPVSVEQDDAIEVGLERGILRDAAWQALQDAIFLEEEAPLEIAIATAATVGLDDDFIKEARALLKVIVEHQEKVPLPEEPVEAWQYEATLPEGWQEFTDVDHGQNYYYKEKTGEYRWERPTEALQDLPGGWQEVTGADHGHIYYYNEKTGGSSWERPTEDYVSEDMGIMEQYVSEEMDAAGKELRVAEMVSEEDTEGFSDEDEDEIDEDDETPDVQTGAQTAALQDLKTAILSKQTLSIKLAMMEAEAVGVADAEIDAAQEILEEEARHVLDDAIASGDSVSLEAAMITAKEAGLPSEDIAEAELTLEAALKTEDEEEDLEEVAGEPSAEDIEEFVEKENIETQEASLEKHEEETGITRVVELHLHGGVALFRRGKPLFSKSGRKFLHTKFKAALAAELLKDPESKYVLCPHVGTTSSRKDQRARKLIYWRGATLGSTLTDILMKSKLISRSIIAHSFGHYRNKRFASVIVKAYAGDQRPTCYRHDLKRFSRR